MINSCPVTPSDLRHDWTVADIEAIYTAALPDLVFRAQTVHRAHHRATEVQGCMLLSIKTGGCPEDCAYCPQSAHYKTDVTRSELVSLDDLTAAAVQAKAQGATRFCMGAAWRDVPTKGQAFSQVLDMVRVVRGLDMEACCTLGMLTQDQADALADAGLTAYNHNLDTSPEFYGSIITTRTYEERLATLARVRKAGVTVCSGGIIGMGEDRQVRYRLLQAAGVARPAPGERAGEHAGSRRGHAARRRAAGGSVRAGSDDRHRSYPDAGVFGPPERRPPAAVRRGAGALLPGWRQLGVPR